MKTLLITATLLTLAFTACNSGDNQGSTASTEKATDQKSAENATGATSTQGIVDSYMKVKNALTEDNDKEASSAAKELIATFASFDKSSLDETQAKEFTDIHEDAKEHAEHIAANAGNLKHQREHFETLSKDVYDLVKSVGGNQKLYYDHCPMYNNNKGANWLSETKEIKNPYLGKAMQDCGTVKEELN